ncbi:GNAT family N-acetyltransferase [Cellulomonas marina]|uniref:GNAT family N-acetyltransferase n=1 Tax=Cellulomonas marina TaxID=988821 RepID=UPI003CC82DBA
MGDEVVCVGALRTLDADHVELKSMHTAAEARGQGYGRGMLTHLLDEAARRGARSYADNVHYVTCSVAGRIAVTPWHFPGAGVRRLPAGCSRQPAPTRATDGGAVDAGRAGVEFSRCTQTTAPASRPSRTARPSEGTLRQ